MPADTLNWHAHARALKWNDFDKIAWARARCGGREPKYADFLRLNLAPDDIVEVDGNLLTTAGATRIVNLFTAGGAQALTNSRMAVGVGDSTTAATTSDASLGGNSSTHSWWQAPDATYPSVSSGTITTNSTFGVNDGNFTAGWQEWGWGIATAAVSANAVFATATTSGVLVNHKIQSMGIKVSGAIWVLQSSATIS